MRIIFCPNCKTSHGYSEGVISLSDYCNNCHSKFYWKTGMIFAKPLHSPNANTSEKGRSIEKHTQEHTPE